MHIEEAVELDFKDVLIRPQRSTLGSRSEVSLLRAFTTKWGGVQLEGCPIIGANMDTVGTISMAKELFSASCYTAIHKHYPLNTLIEFFEEGWAENSFYSLGITPADLEKFNKFKVLTPFIKNHQVCIDVANGYSERFLHFVEAFRKDNPGAVIMAGNVVSREMTEALILAGADIVKVGIGPGSVCTTRKMTGVGRPQLSAVIECANAAHGLGGLVCSDGGCTNPGDVAKAFGAGADFVMLGGMLAGHAESEGELTNLSYKLNPKVKIEDWVPAGVYAIFEGHEYSLARWDHEDRYQELARLLPPHAITATPTENTKVKFYGMSSSEAMNKYNGGVADYRSSEGKVVEIPYRGPVVNTIKEILGGLRSACTYTGAARLKDLSKRCTFLRVTQQINNVFGAS